MERFLGHDTSEKRKTIYYLVAGLWAFHPILGDRSKQQTITLAEACAAHIKKDKSSYENDKEVSSTEKRFLGVIDADDAELFYRLRQLLSLLKEYPINFSELLKDLQQSKSIRQKQWARTFYKNILSTEENKSFNTEVEHENNY